MRFVMNMDRRGLWQSLALLCAGVAITLLMARSTKSAVDAADVQDFNYSCSELQAKILKRRKDCETLLRSAAAFYDRTGHVSREEWHRFVEQHQIERQFPGIQGVGFSLLIPRADLARHVEAIRAEGFPEYQLRPAGDREVYSAITLLEPFSGRNLRAFGYDMLSEPVRRAAMERACDENAPALSGKVILVQETAQNVQAGTLMFLPVFRRGLPVETVADRRAALLGWVYSPYRMDDLMHGITEGRDLASERRIRLRVFDGGAASAETLLFDSQAGIEANPGTAAPQVEQLQIFSAGRAWTLQFTRAGQGSSFQAGGKVGLVLFGGLSTSLLLSGLLYSLHNTRFKAQQMAGQLTAELRASEENFRTFFESMADMIFIGTPEGRLIFTNQAVTQTLGYSAEELARMHVLDVHPSDRRQEAEAIFAAMFRGERTNCPLPLAGKDGTLVPVETRIWFGRWNGANCLYGISKNLSAEEDAYQRFERLFRHNPSLMALSTLPDRRFSDANEAFLRVLGYSLQDVVGKTVGELGLFPEPESHAAASTKLLTEGRIASIEMKVRRRDGTIIYGLFSGEVIRSQGRQFFLTVMNDITPLKRMEKALKATNDRLFLAAQAGGVGIWDYYVADNELVWDAQMCRLYGIPRDKFNGNYDVWTQRIHPEDRPRAHELIQLALRGEKNFDTEFRVVWPDGSIHNIRALALVQRDPAGVPLRMIGTNWDISEHMRHEAEMAALLEKEREISEMKSRFISTTSHEFRTPMAAAMAAGELLANHFDRFPPGKRHELLTRVNSSLHRMTDMLDEILLLNRLDQNRVEVQFQPLDLRLFLHDLIEEVRLGDRDAHRFALHANGAAAPLLTDHSMFHHIVSNLLSNAVRYSPAGTVVTVRMRAEETRVEIAIEDQGIGIPPADRARIFEPFERGSNVGTIAGTGLGLNIVKRMTERLGGTISFESIEEGGTRFFLGFTRPAPPPS